MCAQVRAVLIWSLGAMEMYEKSPKRIECCCICSYLKQKQFQANRSLFFSHIYILNGSKTDPVIRLLKNYVLRTDFASEKGVIKKLQKHV